MNISGQLRSRRQFIEASEFKARCVELVDQVALGDGDIVITRSGRAVARLSPYAEKPATLFGIDKDRLLLLGDVVAPLDGD